MKRHCLPSALASSSEQVRPLLAQSQCPDALPPCPSLLADPLCCRSPAQRWEWLKAFPGLPVERSLNSYQGSSPEPRRLGHRQQLEKLSGLCNLRLPSGVLCPELGWLTGPWGEVSSDAEGACWGSLWGLSNILKGSLFLSLGPFRNVCQLFQIFKPHFFFHDCGLWILLCLRHKLEPLEQFSQYYSSHLDR